MFRLILNIAPRRSASSYLQPTSKALTSYDFLDLLQASSRLERSLKNLRAVLEKAAVEPRQRAALAISSDGLGLDTIGTPATLESTEEINTVATSFSPFGPSWTDTSTAPVTLSGIYGGSTDDTLTFEVTKGATVGSNKEIRIEIRDGLGSLVDTLSIPRNTPADTPFALSNGLVLSLGAGDADRNDTFDVQVFSSVGSSVDPDKPFDGTRNDNPNFEPGVSVVAGSFDINGATITVDASDTINSVITKITDSDAGVIASFDAQTETITLTHETPGSSQTITLGPDTSGFLDATKLSAASPAPGNDADVDRLIADVPQLSSILGGSFSINGVGITVNTATDTLNDVIARINSSGAGVTAGFSEGRNAFYVKSKTSSDPLTLDDGTSGFFSAVDVEATTHEPRESNTRKSLSDFVSSKSFASGLEKLAQALNDVFAYQSDRLSILDTLPVKNLLRDAINQSIESAFDDASAGQKKLSSKLGLTFSFDQAEGSLLSIDLDQLSEGALSDPEELMKFLAVGDDSRGEDGFINGLLGALDQAEDNLLGRLSSPGSLLDIVT